jgi:hypothetical protein
MLPAEQLLSSMQPSAAHHISAFEIQVHVQLTISLQIVQFLLADFHQIQKYMSTYHSMLEEKLCNSLLFFVRTHLFCNKSR